jgi:CRISPR-associated protein Cas1
MKTGVVKISLDGYGSYLGREAGCLVVRDRTDKVKKYPLFENEIAEIRIKSGNMVSSGALATCGFWGIDCLILTQRGNPVAMLKSLSDDCHVRTRICQYQALTNGKGIEIAKQIVSAKLKGQNQILKKYGLKPLDIFRYSEEVKKFDEKDPRLLRTKLMGCEGRFSRKYFSQVLGLFSESIRPERRRTFKAYDGLNNILNVAYRILSWKVQIALIKAKLEPYLGFLHGIQKGQPSLVCDFQDLYRYLVDDFIIQHWRNVDSRDFILKNEDYSTNRKGKRQYLNETMNREFVSRLNRYFETRITIPRIRRGEHQEIETLISEEALLFARYLRDEKPTWQPRVVNLS